MMRQFKSPLKSWVYHAEWIGLMGTIIGCFLFVHHESINVTKRLDDHITQINRRTDEVNKRADDLHKAFYELLKEGRK